MSDSPDVEPEPEPPGDPLIMRMEGVTAHGDRRFEVPFITQLDATLFQGGCMDGLLLPGHIEHVVSLYTEERYTVGHRLASQLSVTMADSLGTPDTDEVVAIATWVNSCRRQGPTLVHCQAGLNRSSMIIAAAYMLDGMTAPEAIAMLREKRSPAALCNPSFERWLLDFQPAAEPTRYEIG
jgi:protein-tyrosine phosphatase